MESSTPGTTRSLAQVGYEAAMAVVGMAEHADFTSLDDLKVAQWAAAASAIVVAYDASLFQKAESEAVAMGLDPMPVPEAAGMTHFNGEPLVDEDGNTAEPLKAGVRGHLDDATAAGVTGSEAKPPKGSKKA